MDESLDTGVDIAAGNVGSDPQFAGLKVPLLCDVEGRCVDALHPVSQQSVKCLVPVDKSIIKVQL